jgi:hypothetical protein
MPDAIASSLFQSLLRRILRFVRRFAVSVAFLLHAGRTMQLMSFGG